MNGNAIIGFQTCRQASRLLILRVVSKSRMKAGRVPSPVSEHGGKRPAAEDCIPLTQLAIWAAAHNKIAKLFNTLDRGKNIFYNDIG